MMDWFSKLTLDVISSTAFGVDTNVQMGENTEMTEEAKAFFNIPYILRQLVRLPFVSSSLRLLLILRGTKQGYLQGVVKEIIKTRRQQGLTGRRTCSIS